MSVSSLDKQPLNRRTRIYRQLAVLNRQTINLKLLNRISNNARPRCTPCTAQSWSAQRTGEKSPRHQRLDGRSTRSTKKLNERYTSYLESHENALLAVPQRENSLIASHVDIDVRHKEAAETL